MNFRKFGERLWEIRLKYEVDTVVCMPTPSQALTSMQWWYPTDAKGKV